MVFDLEQELTALVGIESITGDETEIRDHLAGRLDAMGLEVDSFDVDPAHISSDPAFPGFEVERATLPVVCAEMNSGATGRHVLLSGHVDVVPPGDPATWVGDPFRPEVRDGAVFGRGACDMKGGLAAILATLDRLIEIGHPGPVTVAFVPSEEDGGAGTLAAIRRGVTADVAVVPEPTNLEIVTAHAGAITFRLDVPGKAAHASTRREGVSALDGLAVVLEALREDEERRNLEPSDPRMAALGLPYPSMVGMIEGGSWASTVMDTVTIHGRYGVKLEQDCAGAERDLRAALTRAWEADPFLRDHPLRLRVYGARFDPCAIAPDHALVTGLTAAFERVAAKPASIVGAPYGADMRLFVNTADIPAVMFGPGDIRHAHAANERVALEDVTRCVDVLVEWIGAGDTAD